MILEHKTPAQVRSQLEGMVTGLDVVKNIRAVDLQVSPQMLKREAPSFATNQRAS
jgi:hypothetical protein